MSNKQDFQTPPAVCDYMADMLCGPNHNAVGQILEPTPGEGNLVRALKQRHPHADIIAPQDFWKLKPGSRFDYACMNPPFSPYTDAFTYLYSVMGMTNNIVALVPWLILINSKRRLHEITKSYGLINIVHLPRETFKNSRIQCCILKMKNGYIGQTVFKTF